MNERKKALLFAVTGVAAFGILVLGAALRQGWFESRSEFKTHFKSASGLYAGTPVILMGLKVGEVESVELDPQLGVLVKFSVRNKYKQHIRAESKAVAGRTFVIGEKVISIEPGDLSAAVLPAGSSIRGDEALELVDLLSGGHMAHYFSTFEKLVDQLNRILAGGQSGKGVDLVVVYEQLYKTLKAVETVGNPETKKLISNLAKSTENLHEVMNHMNTALPAVQGASLNVNQMVPEMSKALKEVTFTLQAMQRSFILRGGVENLQSERKNNAQNSERMPASAPNE